MTSLRDIERASIRQFLTDHQHLLTGKVLDYGAGKQPYRDIVESAGAEYHAYDRSSYGGSLGVNVGMADPLREGESLWNAVICTQVLQYATDPHGLIMSIRSALPRGAHLLMTGPTNWPIVEADDLWRFTPAGVSKMLYQAGYKTWDVRERAHVDFQGERWCIGWQATASA